MLDWIRRPLAFAALATAALGCGLVYAVEQGCLHLNHPSPTELPVRGIDVSHHQGAIDWDEVAAADIAFAWIKATEGGDWTDSRFEENWASAGRAGVRRGAYHFFTLCRPGTEQAAHFLSQVPADEADLPPVIDLEYGGNCSARPSTQDLRREVTDFTDALLGAGHPHPLLYVTDEIRAEHLVTEALPHALWVRDIFSRPEGDWTFWQFHNRGQVPGIDGPVDLNVFRGDEGAFAQWLTAVSTRVDADEPT